MNLKEQIEANGRKGVEYCPKHLAVEKVWIRGMSPDEISELKRLREEESLDEFELMSKQVFHGVVDEEGVQAFDSPEDAGASISFRAAHELATEVANHSYPEPTEEEVEEAEGNFDGDLGSSSPTSSPPKLAALSQSSTTG